MTSRWIPAVLTVTTALLAASCAGPDGSGSQAVRPIETTPSTVQVLTTIPAPTATSSSTTTTTTTASSSTTRQPADPEAATKQEIAQVMIRSREAILDSVYTDPPAPSADFQSLYTEDLASHLEGIFDDLRSAGLRTRTATPDLESTTVVSVEIISDTEAMAIACVVLNNIAYDPDTNAIVNDDLSTTTAQIQPRISPQPTP